MLNFDQGLFVPGAWVRVRCTNYVGQGPLCQALWSSPVLSLVRVCSARRLGLVRDLCAKRCGQGPLCQLVGQGLLCQALWSGSAVPEALFRYLGLELTQGDTLTGQLREP